MNTMSADCDVLSAALFACEVLKTDRRDRVRCAGPPPWTGAFTIAAALVKSPQPPQTARVRCPNTPFSTPRPSLRRGPAPNRSATGSAPFDVDRQRRSHPGGRPPRRRRGSTPASKLNAPD